MNFIDNNSWWPFGQSILKEVYSGIIADDRNFQDCIIHENEHLQIFKETIAVNIVVGSGADYELFSNTKDVFLNGSCKINFEESCLIVVMSAEIRSVFFSDIFDCYLVMLSKKSVDEKFYSAALCSIVNNDINNDITINTKPKFQILNKKTTCTLNIGKPANYNDDYCKKYVKIVGAILIVFCQFTVFKIVSHKLLFYSKFLFKY